MILLHAELSVNHNYQRKNLLNKFTKYKTEMCLKGKLISTREKPSNTSKHNQTWIIDNFYTFRSELFTQIKFTYEMTSYLCNVSENQLTVSKYKYRLCAP